MRRLPHPIACLALAAIALPHERDAGERTPAAREDQMLRHLASLEPGRVERRSEKSLELSLGELAELEASFLRRMTIDPECLECEPN